MTTSERERNFRVQTCGRYSVLWGYAHPERGYPVYDQATNEGWYTRTRSAAKSAAFYLNEMGAA